ncbi:hypothetical protein [Bacteroides sp.]|uniref:hypothetical protein n=1 Tax=Bacteroides sp. TaxID=29523 RepID=UPI0023CE6DCB|nr:hypothetical protein [Bacteroides sp.]MDE6214862.1 hypothetical protein [Bacteroides sp.]
MQNDLFKFNISIGRAFIFKINKIDQFFEYINQLIIPKDLNKLFQGHDLDDFLRNYSDDELLSIVKYFPEKARAFMVNEYGKLFDENAVTELDECIKDKRYFEPLRYYMWNKFISLGSWHIYLEELSYGQSEDWAERVASGKPGRSLDDRYRCAFRSLINRDWNSAMRNLRLNIRRRFANENDIFADKYFDLITGWTSNPLTEAQSYMSIYNVCINEGRSQAFADIFAKGMTSGNRAGDEAYWLNKAEKCNLQKD